MQDNVILPNCEANGWFERSDITFMQKWTEEGQN